MEQKEKIKSFKDLIVWQEAHKLVLIVYDVTKLFPGKEEFGLSIQMRRAAVSVTSNIAEGLRRQSNKEKIQFYSLSLGSLSELENQSIISRDVKYIGDKVFDQLTEQIQTVFRLLNAFIRSTKASKLHSTFHIPHSSQKGFTLIELLVVIFMIAAIATVSIANYRNGEKKQRVDLAVDAMINGIRNTQNNSFTSRQIGVSTCANKSAKYYRIDFSSSSEFIMAAEDNCNTLYEIERYKLPEQIRMKSGGLLLDSTVANTLSIKFTSPFAKLSAASNGGAYNSFTSAVITVEHVDSSRSDTVTVDGVSGRIGR